LLPEPALRCADTLTHQALARLVGEGPADPKDPDRPGNVLDLLFAQILKYEGQPVAHVIVDRIGDEHPAGIGQGFDPRRDVDAVTASTTLANSTSMPSPVVFTMRPRWSVIFGSRSSRRSALGRSSVPYSSAPARTIWL
jgi:hypothetical protein